MFSILRMSAVVLAIAWYSPIRTADPIAGDLKVPSGTSLLAEAAGADGVALAKLWDAVPDEVRLRLVKEAAAGLLGEAATPKSRDTLNAADRRPAWRGPPLRG